MSEQQELRPNAGKPYSYTWIWSGENPNRMLCALDPAGNQKLSAFFWELQEPTLLHDEMLAQATREINEVVSRCEQRNQDPNKKLCFISVASRPFLVWAEEAITSPFDDPDAIAEAFGLKRDQPE